MKVRLTRREYLKLTGLGGAAALLAAAGGCQSLGPPTEDGLAAGRYWGPLQRVRGVPLPALPISWEAATARVGEIFEAYAPHEIVFLLGFYPDHLNHLARLISRSLGGAGVLRFGVGSGFEARLTLLDACRKLYGYAGQPVFDLATPEVIFSFGASFTESWLAPAGAAPGGGTGAAFSRINPAAYVVQFEARLSPAAAFADEWIPVRPGSEAQLARALAGLVGGGPAWAGLSTAGRDLRAAERQTGVPARQLVRLARLFARAGRRLALPGGAALAAAGGLQAAQWILALNRLNTGPEDLSDFFLAPPGPLYPELASQPASAAEVSALVQNIELGRVKALFVHGVDPLAVFPHAYRFERALDKIERLVSFATYVDGISRRADLVLPDHAPGEGWGYQVPPHLADQGRVALLRPRRAPRFNTRATADVLLGALKASAGPAGGLDFQDERDFLSRSTAALDAGESAFRRLASEGGSNGWFEPGGWCYAEPRRFPPVTLQKPTRGVDGGLPPQVEGSPHEVYRLLIYPADGGVRRSSGPPAAEIHPSRAERSGFKPGDLALVRTAAGSLCVRISINPGLHPDALALAAAPTDLGHELGGATGLSRPIDLAGLAQNGAGDLVVTGLPARLERLV